MNISQPLSISIRSYGMDSRAHSHGFVQLVLPLSGSLEIDLAGHGALLDRTRAAFVPAGTRHSQHSRGPNCFLIVDVPPRDLDTRLTALLAARRFPAVTQAAAHLIDYMAGSLESDSTTLRAALWTPLLLDALAGELPRPSSRLAGLLAAVDANPCMGWTVADMAARAGLSASRLHALFQEDLGTTPRAWLAGRRLEHVRRWLAATRMPIAEIAARAGFFDQSALTRAVRRATGMTPAAYRRQAQESGPRTQ
jgi:AraC-like DNA-binding protein